MTQELLPCPKDFKNAEKAFRLWLSNNVPSKHPAHVNTILYALTRAASPSEWQPIESVPRNGQLVRLHYGFGQERILKYMTSRHYWGDFEGDINYEAENEGMGKPILWQLYSAPPNNHNRSGEGI